MARWNVEDLRDISNRYNEMLRLTSFPVAVKMFEHLDELHEVKDAKGRPVRRIGNGNFTVCQLLAQARYLGKTIAGTADNLSMCLPGAAAMGFQDLPEGFADGHVRAYYSDEEIARKNMAAIPNFEAGKYEAMLASPLGRMPVDPDIVLFFGNTAQIYRFIHSYLYNKVGRLEFSSSGLVGCSDLIVAPLQSGKPGIALPSNGGRLAGWFSDEEAGCGVPANILEDVLEGLEFTHRGGIRYPITWQSIETEVQGSLRNVMQGNGFFPPEMRHPQK